METGELLGQKKEGNGWSVALVLLCCFLLTFLLLDLRFAQKYLVVEVSGRSMENTVFDGDYLYAARDEIPERGDVVIIDVSSYRDEFRFSGDYVIKRVIGIEGDVVSFRDGSVYLKRAGESEFDLLSEDYANGATYTGGAKTVAVGEGEIFFLGDHRTDSTDSRIVGCFRASDVAGVVPEWALEHKEWITRWESFRSGLGAAAKTLQS